MSSDRKAHRLQEGRTANGHTTLEVTVKGRRDRAQVVLDLDTLLAQAEQQEGDPIRNLLTHVLSKLAELRVALSASQRGELEQALAKGAGAPTWPPTITLKGAASPTSEPVSPAAPSNGRPAAARPWPRELFEESRLYPDADSQAHLAALVGLEEHAALATKEAALLLAPQGLRAWMQRHHAGAAGDLLGDLGRGSPLLIFAGDVGTGKTALAESIPDAIARKLGKPVRLYRLSIRARGTGIVGQMSQQVTDAFAFIEREARETRELTILLLDEADSLATSRETAQMHHEDRAGVNALIQGIDRLRKPDVPAMVIFSTNRGNALDPAIRRRAAHYFRFHRPNDVQRRTYLARRLGPLGFTGPELDELVALTGPRTGRPEGFTYSDLADRLIRTSVLEAFPDGPVTFATVKRLATTLQPTPPFGDA